MNSEQLRTELDSGKWKMNKALGGWVEMEHCLS